MLHRDPDPYPASFTTWINSVRTTIGATKTFTESNSQVYSNFASTGQHPDLSRGVIPIDDRLRTGDWMRNSSPDLARVVDAGVRFFFFSLSTGLTRILAQSGADLDLRRRRCKYEHCH